MNYQARIANVSKSIYVAALIEGAPPPRNHAQAVAALQASTNRLAVISTDLSAYGRHRGALSLHLQERPVVTCPLPPYQSNVGSPGLKG